MSSFKQEPVEHLVSVVEQLKLRNGELAEVNNKYRKEISQREGWSKAQIGLLLEENSRLLGQIGKLETLVSKLTSKAMERQEVIKILKEKTDHFEVSISQLQREYGGYFTEMSQHKLKVAHLQAKNARLKEQLKQASINVQFLTSEVDYRRRELNSRTGNRRASNSNLMRNQVKAKSPLRYRQKGQFEQLRQQVESTMATLDQMNSLSQHQQQHIKGEMEKKIHQFGRLKEEFQRMRSIYDSQILGLMTRNRMLTDEIRSMDRSQQGDSKNLGYCLEILRNCLQHGLPYIKSIRDNVPREAQFIVEGVEALLEQLQSTLKQSKEIKVDQALYTQQIARLKTHIEITHQKYTDDVQKLNQDLVQLEEERNSMMECLRRQIESQQATIDELESGKKEILDKMYRNNRIDDIGEHMLQLNDENTTLKVKNFETRGLLEALLYLLVNLVLDWDRKEGINQFYRVCEKHYWETRSILKALPGSTPFRSSPISKLKKAGRAVLFLCSLKVANSRRQENQRLSLSDIPIQLKNRRLLSLLSKHSNYSQRVENRAVEEFKFKEEVNMFSELVSMLDVQMGNETLKRLNQHQVGWSVYQIQVEHSLQNTLCHLRIPPEPSREKPLANSRSVGSFRKIKCN